MTIRLTRSLLSKNGTFETSSSVIEKDDILFGRSGDSDIALEGKEISLHHARISKVDAAYVIEDLDSLSGVAINGKLLRRHILKNGDTIKLADHSFNVQIINNQLELNELQRAVTLSADEDLRRQVEALNFKSAFPSLKALSWGGILSILAVSLYPVILGNRLSWSSGPITSHHKMIEANCASCHAENFSRIADSKCLSCHELSPHAKEFLTAHRSDGGVLNRDCVSCHREHDHEHALIAKESSLCASCHASIKSALPSAQIPDISSWETHPEFTVTLRATDSKPGSKVSLSEKAALIDPTHLKLNHELHLKPDLRGKDGAVTLQCNDCHKLSADHRTIEPLTMEKNCSGCHTLEFDERLPETHVPHGKPDLVYKFLYAEYAKLMLASSDNQADAGRQRPGSTQNTQNTPAFARAEIIKQSRSAERELFTRTACKLCHEIAELSDIDAASDHSQFAVLDPKLPARWMPAARFSHGAHEEITCESCHKSVRTSTKTQDVLLPEIADCKACHAGHPATGMLMTNCVDCHSYHDSLPLDVAKKRSLENIVTSLGNRK